MGFKKKSVIIFIVSIIIIVITVLGWWCYMQPIRALDGFSKRIEDGKLEDVRLTIYSLDPILTNPVSIDSLINGWHDHKTVIILDGHTLQNYIYLLSQVNSNLLVPVRGNGQVDARTHYIFETNNGKRLFDVTMWSWDTEGNSIIMINGRTFEWNDVFLTSLNLFCL